MTDRQKLEAPVLLTAPSASGRPAPWQRGEVVFAALADTAAFLVWLDAHDIPEDVLDVIGDLPAWTPEWLHYQGAAHGGKCTACEDLEDCRVGEGKRACVGCLAEAARLRAAGALCPTCDAAGKVRRLDEDGCCGCGYGDAF